jgi:peptidoglycan/LPS O-acetylase OafA/YrhL
VSTSPRFGDTWGSVLLDLLRALAAFMVLAEHWRNFFFVDFSELPVSHRRMFAVPYALSVTGHEAVIIFFLLSGFLICGSVLRMLKRNAWTWRGYATHRLVRLWIVILPGLVLGAMWDTLGVSVQHTRLLYVGDAANHMMHNVAYQRQLTVFLGNVFFLQGVAVPTFGSNGALWSLANEFWYYVLFPLGLLALWNSQRLVMRVSCGLLFIVIAFWLRGSLLPRFPIWLAGAFLSMLPELRVSTRIRWVAALIYVGVVVALQLSAPHLALLVFDFLFAIGTAALLWVFVSSTSVARPTRTVRAIRFLARGSFSLYVVHMPLLAFVAAYCVGASRWKPTPMHLLEALVILAFTVVYAFAIAYFTEFRTDRVRGWIELRFPALTGQRRPT